MSGVPFELWPEQVTALDMLRRSLQTGHRRPVLQAPTGFGKTILAAHIVTGALRKGNRVAFVVPLLNLVDQTLARFCANGIELADIGVMQGDHTLRRPHAPVQICSAATIVRRGFPEVDLVVVDECHVRFAAVDNWMTSRSDMIFVGLSATPWSAGMAERWDDLIVPTSIAELIAAGRLSPFRVFAPSHPDLSGVKTVAGDFHEGELSERMSEAKLVADVVTTWLEKGNNEPTLCFAVDRPHAQLLHEQFEAMGVAAAYVDAFTSREERQALAEKFGAGATKIVVSVGTMTTGVDLDVRCLILARPTRSEILFTQIIGRALRTAPGKTVATILDHSDTHLRLGMVTDIRHVALKPSNTSKCKSRGKEKLPAVPLECPRCTCLIPVQAGECPSCGLIPKRAPRIVSEDGELVELGKMAPPKRDKANEFDFIRQLRGYAHERGYAQGWVANKFREKFGVWPNAPTLKYAPSMPCGPIVRSWIRSRAIAWAKRSEKDLAEVARADAEGLADAH